MEYVNKNDSIATNVFTFPVGFLIGDDVGKIVGCFVGTVEVGS